MSRRSPAKLPSLYTSKYPASPPPNHTSSATQRLFISEPALEAALQQINNSFANLDFPRFFKNFPRGTPIYQYIESFDIAQFTQNVLQAFPDSIASLTTAEVQATKDAKIILNERLRRLDLAFMQMQEAGMDIGYIRLTLHWIAKRNHETYVELGNVVPHPLDSNPLPPPPKHFHCVTQQYVEPPVSVHYPTTVTFPEEIHPTSIAAPQPPHPTGPKYYTSYNPRMNCKSKMTASPMHVNDANAPSPLNLNSAPSQFARETPGEAQAYGNPKHEKSSPYFDAHGSSMDYPDNITHAPKHRHRSAYVVRQPSPPIVSTARSSPRSNHQAEYEEDDENAPFIPPPPYEWTMSFQGPRRRKLNWIMKCIHT